MLPTRTLCSVPCGLLQRLVACPEGTLVFRPSIDSLVTSWRWTLGPCWHLHATDPVAETIPQAQLRFPLLLLVFLKCHADSCCWLDSGKSESCHSDTEATRVLPGMLPGGQLQASLSAPAAADPQQPSFPPKSRVQRGFSS